MCVRVCVAGLSAAAAAQSNQGDKQRAAEERRKAAEAFIGGNRNKNTALTYAGGWKRFQGYLTRVGVAVEEVTEVEVAAFLQERWQVDGVKSSTLQADKAAIADGLKGHKSSAAAGRMVTEMMAVLATKAGPPTPKRHMSLELMRDILKSLKREGDIAAVDMGASPPAIRRALLARRNYCLLLFMLLGMLRASEAVDLKEGDVVLEANVSAAGEQKTVSLFIRRSKGDQEKKGEEVRLGQNKGDELACPVGAYKRYKDLKASHREGKPTDAFFSQLDGMPLAVSTPNHIVKNAVNDENQRWQRATGEEQHFGSHDEYGSHSMRRGGVTLARDSGVSMLDIQRHGRWKSLLVFDYVGRTLEQQLAVTARLMQAPARSASEAPARQDSDCVLVEARGQGDKLGKAAVAAGAGGAGAKVSRGVSRKPRLTLGEEEEAEDLDSDIFVPKHTSGAGSIAKPKSKPRGPRGPYGPRKRKAPDSEPRAGKKPRLTLTPVVRSAPTKRAAAVEAATAAPTAAATVTAAAAHAPSGASTRAKRRLEMPIDKDTNLLTSSMLTQRK